MTQKQDNRERYPSYHILRLCIDLGFDSNDRRDPRSSHELKQKLRDHRKRFIENEMEQGTQFPWVHNHEVAQMCARQFIEQNGDIFSHEVEETIGPKFFPSAHDRYTDPYQKNKPNLTII